MTSMEPSSAPPAPRGSRRAGPLTREAVPCAAGLLLSPRTLSGDVEALLLQEASHASTASLPCGRPARDAVSKLLCMLGEAGVGRGATTKITSKQAASTPGRGAWRCLC